jgi:hypothetical protein
MKQQSTQAQVAKLVRQQLKAMGIRAKVTSDSFAGGNSVDVRCVDLPAGKVRELEKLFKKYQYGHFNGMEDIYEISNSRDDLPQVKYLHVTNELSDERKQSVYSELRGKWASLQGLPESYQEACNMRDSDGNYVAQVVWRHYNNAA